MNRAEKTELASQLKDKFSKAKVALFADYKGLSANQADELRKQVRNAKGEVKVLKNNLGRLISKDGSMGGAAQTVLEGNVGPTLVAFSYGDPAALAKVVHKFAQDNEAFKLKESLMEATKLAPNQIEELAKLPSKEVLVAKFLGTLNAPVSNFVGVLAAVPRSLVTVLSAIEKKKANPQA